MTLSEKSAALVESFELLPDQEERFAHVISLGRQYPAMDPSAKTNDRLIPGCVSQLWLQPELREGRCYFNMDADALISKGTAALVCDFYNGETPADVAATEPEFLNEVGLQQALSMNRSNGLSSLRKRIREFAQSHLPADG